MDASIDAGRAWLRAEMNARRASACPLCSRKVLISRRRVHKSQAETLVAIGLETIRRRSQSDPAPWIHVEHDLIREGLAECVGRDWAQLRHFRVIEPKTSDRNPKGVDVGLWRLTPLGLEVIQNPRRELLPLWVDTWDKRAWAWAPRKVSLVSCLGRSFDFKQEIRRAS